MRRGFTLVELMVVLVILAALTHLAVHEVAQIRDQKLVQMADRQLEEIRTASTAYLADVGSPVQTTNGTLSALWVQPSFVRPFAVRQAVATNLVKGAQVLADESVYVPTGWRGPYIKLPLGKTRLLDPWGNPLEEKDEAGLVRVAVTNGLAVSVSHYGPSGQSRQRRTCSLLPDGGSSSRLFVTAVSTGGEHAGDIQLSWYGPAQGLITGAVQTVIIGSTAVFANLTPGVRIVKDNVTRQARQVVVKPGDNLVEIKLP